MGLLLWTAPAEAAVDTRDARIEQLESQVQSLQTQLTDVVAELHALRDEQAGQAAAVQRIQAAPALDSDTWVNRFNLGGYGEMHANFDEGEGDDRFDLHRLVFSIGYDFTDRLSFSSEIELEHAFVTDGAGGELLVEQAYVDWLLADWINLRAGRMLAPLGITNQWHEPPLLFGVERPAFDTVVIPTTWSVDGAGIFGRITPSLKYQAYVVGGLDGSELSALKGLRGGRIKERASWNEPAFTARLDYYPFALRPGPYRQELRLGASTYLGGIDNGNNGDDPGVDGSVRIFSGDFDYSVLELDVRGALAWIDINGAEDLGDGVAEEIFGWYLEAGYHVWPDAWRTEMLERADAIVFARYEDFDTQHEMPSGVRRDPRGDRTQWTLGVNFYPIPNFVMKADWQMLDDATADDLDLRWNLGIGWQF